MESTVGKINMFIEQLVPPLKSKVAILSVTLHEKTGEPAGLGVLKIQDARFTGKQFFTFFGKYSPKTAEGKIITEAGLEPVEAVEKVSNLLADSYVVVYSQKDIEKFNDLVTKHNPSLPLLDLHKTFPISKVAKVLSSKGDEVTLQEACKLFGIVVKEGFQDYALTDAKCCAALLIKFFTIFQATKQLFANYESLQAEETKGEQATVNDPEILDICKQLSTRYMQP